MGRTIFWMVLAGLVFSACADKEAPYQGAPGTGGVAIQVQWPAE